MDILEILEQVRVLLQKQGRVSYRILKRQFALDDDALEDLTFELIEAQKVAVDEDGKVLVWTGQGSLASSVKETEECFLKAVEVAQHQQAKSLELRAVISLVRLRQQQEAQSESRTTDHVPRNTQHARSSMKLTACSLRSTIGSRKGLTRRTCKRQKRSSRN